MNFVTSISLVVLGAMFLALLGWGSIRAAWRNCEGRRGVFAALAILAAICSIVAQKPSPDTPTITVDALLRDVGCYATNNVFHAAVTNAPSYAGVDFSDCDLMVYARERASSDAASWFELTPRKKFSQQPADYAIENATNYNYMIWLDYVPPSPVHTNGVFELRGFVVPGDVSGNLEQLAAGFINSRAILPPPTARDYIQDGLIAMWDGIENAGWGTHDPNATVWVDLTGNHSSVATTSAALSWGVNCLQFANAANMESRLTALEQKYGHGNGPMTIEQTGVFADDMDSMGFAIMQFRSSGDQSAGVVAGTVVSLPVTSRDNRYGTGKNAYFPWPSGLYNFGNVRGGDFIFSATTDGNTWGIYEKGALLSKNRTLGTWSWYNLVARFLWATNSAGSKCNGKVYCIRIYSRALSADEIRHNYEIDKERFNLP